MYEALTRRGVEFRFFRRLDRLGVVGREPRRHHRADPAGRAVAGAERVRAAGAGRRSCRAGPSGHWPTSSSATRGRSPSRTPGPAKEPAPSGSSPGATSTSRCSRSPSAWCRSSRRTRRPGPGVARHGRPRRDGGHPFGAAVVHDVRGRPGLDRSGRCHAERLRRDLRHLGLHVAPARARVLAVRRGAAEPRLPLLGDAGHRPGVRRGRGAGRRSCASSRGRSGRCGPGRGGRRASPGTRCGTTEGRVGPDRLDAQYLRANLDPSDRYVQSLPGSGRYRMAPGATGLDNLVVAGDWTACGWDAGSMEAATRSAVLAARAVLAGTAEQVLDHRTGRSRDERQGRHPGSWAHHR